jgi:uncharacterized protein (TIGR03546 family)
MYWIVKLVQSLVKALNSEGTPGQVAAGITLGACLGLTPLLSLHNLVIALAIVFFRVSLPGAMMSWALFTPLGFALDPVFHSIGTSLLGETPSLRPLWARLYNTPGLALLDPTNTIVVGSLAFWLGAAIPIYFASRWAVARYRRSIYERYKDARFFQWVRASRVYGFYRLFRPGV